MNQNHVYHIHFSFPVLHVLSHFSTKPSSLRSNLGIFSNELAGEIEKGLLGKIRITFWDLHFIFETMVSRFVSPISNVAETSTCPFKATAFALIGLSNSRHANYVYCIVIIIRVKCIYCLGRSHFWNTLQLWWKLQVSFPVARQFLKYVFPNGCISKTKHFCLCFWRGLIVRSSHLRLEFFHLNTMKQHFLIISLVGGKEK